MVIDSVSSLSQLGNTNRQYKQPPERDEKEKTPQKGFKLDIEDKVEISNKLDNSVSFDISENPPYIQIKDNEGEVVREIPPEEIRKIREDVDRILEDKGSLVDIKV